MCVNGQNVASEDDFYKKFYEFCETVVNKWKEIEPEVLKKYEEKKDRKCFSIKMLNETDNFQKLNEFGEKREFQLAIMENYYFKEFFKWQKNFLNKKQFANEMFAFQYFSTGDDNRKAGIEFPVYSSYKTKVRLVSNEFLRVLRGFDTMDQDNFCNFFSMYCYCLLSKWYNTEEKDARKRNKQRSLLINLKNVIEEEEFATTANKDRCKDICANYKIYLVEYEKTHEIHPMDELENLLKIEGVYYSNQRVREILLAITIKPSLDNPQRLNVPIDKEDTESEDIVEAIEDKNETNQRINSEKLFEIKHILVQNISCLKMNNRPNLNMNKLNEIARKIILLTFSGAYDLSIRDDLNAIEDEIKKLYANSPNELNIFLHDGHHGFAETIRKLLNSFRKKINVQDAATQEDCDLINMLVDGAISMLPHR